MEINYADWEEEDLLMALELSGERPPDTLIEACLAKREAMTPGLLEMLGHFFPLERVKKDKLNPRTYAPVHAGLLLAEFREEKALPIFDEILRDEERSAFLSHWFDAALPAFGPVVVPQMRALLDDDGAYKNGQLSALFILLEVAKRHPEVRDAALLSIRSLLPPLREDGTVDLPDDEDIGAGDEEVWSWAADALAQLRDEASRAHVLVLMEEEVLDDWILSEEEFLDAMAAPPEAPGPLLSISEMYEKVAEQDRELAEKAAQMRAQMEVAGWDARLLMAMMELSNVPESDTPQERLMLAAARLREVLAEEGVPEEELDDEVGALLSRLVDKIQETRGSDGRITSPPVPVYAPAPDTDYAEWDAAKLLDALERAGRYPADLRLLYAIVERSEETTEGLLTMLAAGVEENWHPDDPRWYREVHAGKLLIEIGEERALPLFEEIFADEEREILMEWFPPFLPAYGAVLIPVLKRIMQRATDYTYAFSMATGLLADVGRCFPETSDEVLRILQAHLPLLDERRRLAFPRRIDDEQVERWTWVVSALMDLRDGTSRARVEALYEQGLIDEDIIGDLQDYRRALRGEEKYPRQQDCQFGVLKNYEEEQKRMSKKWTEQESARWQAHQEEEQADRETQASAEAEVASRETFVREARKVGRNEKVTIRDPESGEERTLKYKQAEAKLAEGWELLP